MNTVTEQERIDEIRSIMLELVKDGIFPLVHKIIIMTPKDGVSLEK